MLKNPTWILLDGCANVRICAVTVLQHIHYINSYVRCHFLIDSYVIFTSLCLTIPYPHTISSYNIFLSLSSTSVSTLDLIPYFFNPISTTFPTPITPKWWLQIILYLPVNTIRGGVIFVFHILIHEWHPYCEKKFKKMWRWWWCKLLTDFIGCGKITIVGSGFFEG